MFYKPECPHKVHKKLTQVPTNQFMQEHTHIYTHTHTHTHTHTRTKKINMKTKNFVLFSILTILTIIPVSLVLFYKQK